MGITIEAPELLANSKREGGVSRPPRRGPASYGRQAFMLDHREDAEGVTKIRGEKGDLAVVFSDRAFLSNIDYLGAICASFASRNLGWSEEATKPIIGRALDVSRLTGGMKLTSDIAEMIVRDRSKVQEIPSVMLIRKAVAAPGQYFAVSAQRMFYIPTSAGEQRADFHILRSVDKLFRGHNIGRWMVDLLLGIHKADFYIHRSSNPMALDTNRKNRNLRQTDSIPFKKPYYVINADGSITPTGIEYEVAETVLEITVGPNYKLGPNGKVKGLYSQPNTAFTPDPKFPGTLELYEQMIKPEEEGGWGADLEAGDTFMATYHTY